MKKVVLSILLCGLLLFNVVSVSAESLSFDFAKNADGWAPYIGEWKVADGVYKQTDSDAGSPNAWDRGTVLAGKQFSDFTMEYKIKADPGGWAGVLIRKAGEGDNHQMSGYLIFINSDGNGAVYKRVDNTLANIGGGIANDFNTVKVVAKGSNIKVYLNGNADPVADVNDSEFASGYISLVAGNCTATFDDVTISTGEEKKEESKAAASTSKEEQPASKPAQNPKTGDAGVVLYVGMAAVSLGAIKTRLSKKSN